jgi:hypothetical protein
MTARIAESAVAVSAMRRRAGAEVPAKSSVGPPGVAGRGPTSLSSPHDRRSSANRASSWRPRSGQPVNRGDDRSEQCMVRSQRSKDHPGEPDRHCRAGRGGEHAQRFIVRPHQTVINVERAELMALCSVSELEEGRSVHVTDVVGQSDPDLPHGHSGLLEPQHAAIASKEASPRTAKRGG